MYVKKAPIKQIRYYLLTLGVVSLFQIVVAFDMVRENNSTADQTAEYISEVRNIETITVE